MNPRLEHFCRHFWFQTPAKIGALLLLGLIWSLPAPAASQKLPEQGSHSESLGVTFADIASGAGLREPIVYGGVNRKRFILETNGCGLAFLDYDNDGWLDILLLNGWRLEGFGEGKEPTTLLYHNERNGTFSNVTTRSGLARTGWASAVTVGDFDNDGDPDIFITYWGQNVLFRNEADGRFTDVTQAAGLKTPERRWGSGCTFIDYDRDGFLDLFVAHYLKFDPGEVPEPGGAANCFWKGIAVNCGPKGLPSDTNMLYRNNGDGTFSDVSDRSGVSGVKNRYAMTSIVTDYNQDGWPDIYVACDSTASILYQNMTDGTFRDVALETGSAYNEDGQAQAGMGVATGDFNGDGFIDIFKTHFADDLPVLYRNSRRGFFEDHSRAAGFDHTPHVQWGTGLVDFDNDGWPDIFTVTGNVYPEVEKFFRQYPLAGPRLLYQNLGDGRFLDVSAGLGLAPHPSRGCAFGDFDNDGDVDVLIMNMNEPPSLLRNGYVSAERRGKNNWLTISLQGTRSNRSAIGALVRLKAGGRQQIQELTAQSSYYSHNDPRLHFGLGESGAVEQIEIRWPNGETQTIRDIAANQIVSISEGSGLSSNGDRE